MSVTFRRYYVSRPSVPPSSSGGVGTLSIAHRRVNKDGQRSELSPILTARALPAAITPQGYSDSFSLLRDEILVSPDGTTWYVVPSAENHTGVLSVPAFNAAWPVTTINGNQSSNGFSLDFADFSPSSEPEQTFYLLNIGESINSLTFNFSDLITNSLPVYFNDTIEVSILETRAALGNNADNSFNGSILWNSQSLNTFSLLLPNLSFLKLRIKMLNYPLGDLQNQVFNLSLSCVINRTSFYLPTSVEWPNRTLFVDGTSPLNIPFISTNTDQSLLIGPYQFNDNGILRSNLVQRSFPFAAGNYLLIFSPTTGTRIEPSTYVPVSGETEVATFTLLSSSPWISNISYSLPIKPQGYFRPPVTSVLARARFAQISGGVLDLATTVGTQIGVTLRDNDPTLATRGLCFIQCGGTVALGDILIPTTDGKAIDGTGGPLVALSAGSLDSIIVAAFIP